MGENTYSTSDFAEISKVYRGKTACEYDDNRLLYYFDRL